MEQEHTRPADIERNSMNILTAEMEQRGLAVPEEYAPVVKRVIHATADFDYAENLVFTDHAVEMAVRYFQKPGSVILTDTNMARAGISRPALEKLQGQVDCFMALPEIAEKARAEGITRAAASVDYGTALYEDAAFAVGNAPTALLRLAEHIQNGYRPALVIGVPVGFVNVVEAKEQMLSLCRSLNIPAVLAMGRKGGSNVAAAVCNALLYTAAEMLDPADRGWN
ncbi:MAG: precorrin-8X methylmutase [Oscillospiraceae bacterium]|nr:precorrin-8X methylmutase [Oscillospiraceae bacterium]